MQGGVSWGHDHHPACARARNLPGGRPVISERGYGFTRQGLDTLRQQRHGEALRRGLGQAAGVRVMGDGAVWIWRRADDRWPQAQQRPDFYHAVQHWAAVGRALWARPGPIPSVAQTVGAPTPAPVSGESDPATGGGAGRAARQPDEGHGTCLREHQPRMDYRAGRRAGEPMGGGPVEATGRQALGRFKRPGRIWSPVGDEAPLCLETFWRNDRWALLCPHTALDPARN